jgi:hypothetical protein
MASFLSALSSTASPQNWLVKRLQSFFYGTIFISKLVSYGEKFEIGGGHPPAHRRAGRD